MVLEGVTLRHSRDRLLASKDWILRNFVALVFCLLNLMIEKHQQLLRTRKIRLNTDFLRISDRGGSRTSVGSCLC